MHPQAHVDGLIIGAGFGGSVSALRLAEKGYSVAVLEKGRRFAKEDCPETNWDLRAEVFVENRFGLDLKWQCWAFTVEYVARNNNEDEIRFALNLLGVGAPITTGTRLGGVSTPGGGGGTAR